MLIGVQRELVAEMRADLVAPCLRGSSLPAGYIQMVYRQQRTMVTSAAGRKAKNHTRPRHFDAADFDDGAARGDRRRARDDHLVEDRGGVGDDQENAARRRSSLAATPNSLISPMAMAAMMTTRPVPVGTMKVSRKSVMMRPSRIRE